MDADAKLPADLPLPAAASSGAAPAACPAAILVTGATGFVGARTVFDLLVRGESRIHCLVRAAGPEAAFDRVAAALGDQGLWRESFRDRLSAHPGDLARPRLGLSDEHWTRLAAECDAVLHAGALVNFLFDYGAHRAANVVGTAEVLRFALTGRPKALHHVSTLGVLDREAARSSNPLAEAFDPTAAAIPASGYSRSKWVAEQMVLEARRQGAPVTLYRLGEVMPAADNGHPNPRALTHLLLTAMARLGVRPLSAMRTDYTPVDHVSRRLVAGLYDPAVRGRTLHVFHPDSVDLGDLLVLPTVSDRVFLARLREAAELATLLALLTGIPHGPAFGALLTDNPRLFRRDECGKFDRAHGLADDPLDSSLAAYRRRLTSGKD